MRQGKIAKLPEGVVEELNPRMDRGGEGPKILGWLNALPEVIQKMVRQQASKAIKANKGKLSLKRGPTAEKGAEVNPEICEMRELERELLALMGQKEAFRREAK